MQPVELSVNFVALATYSTVLLVLDLTMRLGYSISETTEMAMLYCYLLPEVFAWSKSKFDI